MSRIHGNTKFEDYFYVEAYELARAGMLDNQIAHQFGVTPQTFAAWKRNNPAFEDAINRGRKPGATTPGGKPVPASFKGYVHSRLDPALQTIWEGIMGLESPTSDPAGWVTVKEILDNAGHKTRQRLFLHALFHFNFNASEAVRVCCLKKGTVASWMKTDPEFAELYRDIHEIKGDFFEEKLIGLVKAGDSAATIFANKTYNRDRGYNEKIQIETSNVAPTNYIVEEDLVGLPVEILRALMEHINKRRDAKAPVPALPVHQIMDAETVTHG